MNGKPVEIPSLDILASDLSKVDALPPETAKALCLEVMTLEKALMMRAFMAPTTANPPEDRLIGIDEAAAILGMSKDHLYRHHEQYPFAIRVGGLLRFSYNGIQRWIRAQLRHG